MNNLLKQSSLVLFFILSICLKSNGQNIISGLGSPSYGVMIKANFPGDTGGWSRGFRIVNENNTKDYFGLGAMGSINKGISSFSYGWIGKGYSSASLYFLANGNVGLGLASPSEQFEIYKSTTEPGIISLRSYRNDAQFVDVGRVTAKQSKTEIARIGLTRGGGTYTGYLTFWTKASNSGELTQKMLLDANGNLGIGTNNTKGYRLAVNGSIGAGEIKVLNVSSWADFVFEDNYNLRSLNDLEIFIQDNKHLPEIPTEEEVKKDGISVGEMNAKLLQKIEELTLYLIDQNRKIEDLQMVVQQLKSSKP